MDNRQFANRTLCFFLAVMLFIGFMPMAAIIAKADELVLLETTVNVSSGTSTQFVDVEFSAGQAYRVTATWTASPSFTGARAGWSLQTVLDQASPTVGDTIIMTAKKNDAGTDKSVQNFSCLFVAKESMAALMLNVEGLAENNAIYLKVEQATAPNDLVLDVTFDVLGQTAYLNTYFSAAFEANEVYNVSAEWATAPSYYGSTTAWKIQGAASTLVDGNDTIIYRSTRDTTTNTGAQSYVGQFTPTVGLPVFNFFTQSFNEDNEIHITIEKVNTEVPSESITLNVDVGEGYKYFDYQFQNGNAYTVTATWENTPVFTGSLTGWQLETVSGQTDEISGDLIIKAAKKASTSGNGNLTNSFTGTFRATENMSALRLYTQGLVSANTVTITIEPATLTDGVLLDATVSIPANTDYISAYMDVNFEAGSAYDVSAVWAAAPVYTDANESKTAWKVQGAQDSSVAGDDAIIYKTTAASNTAATQYSGTYYCTEAKSVFNFFAQRLSVENSIHFVIEESENVLPVFITDSVTSTLKYQIPNYLNGHLIQGFDIFNDTIFQCYDGGYCATYDFNTGVKIADFALGSCYSTNHCGNANFGTQYPAGNSEYPALYVSGDLTTKACYVENVTSTSANLIQTIYFDIEPSYTGGQVIIDKDRNRILYMQRQNSNIRQLDNTFKIFEFEIPDLSAGETVRYTNADILSAYDLSYYSPLYQGASVYNGRILQTHGYLENAFGSAVGIMNFDVTTHNFDRYIPLGNQIASEPQGLAVYNDKMIVNFVYGQFYELTLD